MGHTMALLPPFIRASRASRTARNAAAPHSAAGLPADDEVLLDVPDDRLGPALVAAGLGAYAPAARLMAQTRERSEWEYRDRYATRLASFAHSRPEWFEEWSAAAPATRTYCSSPPSSRCTGPGAHRPGPSCCAR